MASDIHVSIDESVEVRAVQVLDKLGLTVGDAVRLLLKRVAEEDRLPFTPNPETQAAMEAARRGETVSFASIESLMADLNEDD